ncbi:hypothetical protein Tco_1335628 [Tanacetum coccineum]
MESGSYWLDKVRTSIWRDVRTLAIEEAYTTKYSIHPGADTMLCGFRLTNRWLSMKKDIASCGSKYLAYSEVEVEYQGSSGLYWCSYGSKDHRPSRASYIPKKKSAGRPSTKRGCTCHFTVKHLKAKPSVALIIYNQDKHVDTKGLPCHGPQDEHSVGTRAMYAPSISKEFRQRVISLLHVGISVETIIQRHNESVEIQGGPSNVDDLINNRHMRTKERNIRSNKNIVFFHEEFSDTGPFLLGIQTEWQLQQMIQFGSGRLVALDSRFGTNKLKVRHAWHKYLMKRCSDMQTRANLLKALSQIVKDISKGRGTIESFDSLMEGKGYLCWIDLLNRSKPSAYKEFAPLDNSKATILKH